VTYVYDGDGVRVKKSGGSASPTLYLGESFTAGPIAETDLSGTLKAEYVYFGGKRIARRELPSGAVHYYFSDHLNSTNLVYSASGALEEDSDFYPYGGERGYTLGSGNHFKFTGKERDPESGLDYFGARYYGNSLGRFLTTDPVQIHPLRMLDPQRMNSYAQSRNNPIAYRDPDGRDIAAVGFSKLAAGAGHIGILSIQKDRSAKFGEFGPKGGGKPTWPGHVALDSLKTKVAFDSNGKPTAASLDAVAKELANITGQPESSISLAYYATSEADTQALNAWMQEQFDHHFKNGWGWYQVETNDCRDYAQGAWAAAGLKWPWNGYQRTPNTLLDILMKDALAHRDSDEQPKPKEPPKEKVTSTIRYIEEGKDKPQGKKQ
jgi:RHS repeat-associated protein